jgi:hypothetical protein
MRQFTACIVGLLSLYAATAIDACRFAQAF